MTGNKVDATKRVVSNPNYEFKQADKDKQSSPFAALYNGNAWDFAKSTAGAMLNPNVPNVNHNGAAGFEASTTQPTYG